MSQPAKLFKGEPFGMANRFEVRVDGPLQTLGFWNQVSGLSVSWGLADYRAGDAGNARWYFPGTTTYSNIVLKRAACADSELVKKWLSMTSFQHQSAGGQVILLGPAGEPVISWELRRVLPLKWAIDPFDAGTGKVAIETLELAHEGFLQDHA